MLQSNKEYMRAAVKQGECVLQSNKEYAYCSQTRSECAAVKQGESLLQSNKESMCCIPYVCMLMLLVCMLHHA